MPDKRDSGNPPPYVVPGAHTGAPPVTFTPAVRRPVNIVDDADDPLRAIKAFIGQEMEAGGFAVADGARPHNALRLEGEKRIVWLDLTVIEKRDAR